MTTLTNYRPYYEVLGRVEEVRARLRSLRITAGVLTLITVLASTVLVATVAQGYLRFDPAGRAALLLTGLAVTGIAFWRCIVVPLRWDPNDREVARYLETRLPKLGNNLINAILLAEGEDSGSPALVERAIAEAATGARSVDLMQAVSGRRAKRWMLAAACAAAALAAWATLATGRFTSAGLQILMPWARVASVGDVRLLSVSPGNATWAKGEPLPIEAVISDPQGKPYDGWLEITEGDRTVRKDLVRAAGAMDRFTYRLPQVLQPLTYRVSVGGTESAVFKVALSEPPMIDKIDVVYNYPEYTGEPPRTVKNNGGEIRCLAGTTVALTVHVSTPVPSASLRFGSGAAITCLPAAGGLEVSGRFTVQANDTYRISMEGQAPDGAAVTYGIIAEEDPPPTIQFMAPGRDLVQVPGESVRMNLKAGHVYGLKEVRVMAQVDPPADAKAPPRVLASWRKFPDPKDATLDHVLALVASQFKLGQTITYWAEADDRRPQTPATKSTPKFKIVLEDRKAADAERLRELTRLYDRLREILKVQEQARAGTAGVAKATKLADVQAGGAALAGSQKTIRDGTLAVIKDVKFDAETAAIKETLVLLTANPMASAMARAKALADLADAPRLATAPDLARALAADQDAIIAVLRQILSTTAERIDAVKEDQKRLDPSDLPADLLDKLKNLHDRMKDFVTEQKKVVEASEGLAKKPVDAFNDEDQKKLAKLEAVEDQWDKFLTEAISDFSKIPQVDASNPTLLKELVEVRADVEMAAGALAKDAVTMAVPLEELGMEGAKEIVENLERWLPDTPDRTKWSQEEFTKDVEIPHAELPEQLEDLVGNLLEQEEDLFDQMQDVTSGAADSPDKGAGWDAMDGPISSFSAKGVTGNQLPNDSEISGRSGEGRSGKASGEFVEDSATGKGGRRTPTRLSPDAFAKGDIKDTSPESPGGATGGGKISGGGNQGLEGPVPPETQRRMGALAGKQAQLRNKAEGVKAALEVKNYDSFSLDRAIDGMRKVQRDILAGRYSSALRQKDVVLGDLQGTKMLLGGEVQIRKDTGAALPSEVQKNVLDALDKPMPRGYEEALKHYYGRLNEGS
jgi:hypothetical protein